ncbi:unnamed protein product [Vicia faba]|uniref:Uncharacterized protein n=1 Tax=Vicia faba TaxID=3906 RepID=A0AAV1ALK9_VICFA|nr:unnamed protein product [Vicia faba]
MLPILLLCCFTCCSNRPKHCIYYPKVYMKIAKKNLHHKSNRTVNYNSSNEPTLPTRFYQFFSIKMKTSQYKKRGQGREEKRKQYCQKIIFPKHFFFLQQPTIPSKGARFRLKIVEEEKINFRAYSCISESLFSGLLFFDSSASTSLVTLSPSIYICYDCCV